MAKLKAVFNWSGGKDSTLALHYALKRSDLEIVCLVTTVNEVYGRVSMHGVREELLDLQAESIGLPLVKIYLPEMSDMQTYEDIMASQFALFSAQGIRVSVFGDIFLEDLKKYREEQMVGFGMSCVFPIWQRNTHELINEFICLGYKTVIACCKQELALFCGKILDVDLISQLPAHIDVCGENGEFHTFAFEGPIFTKPIPFVLGEKVLRFFPKPSEHAEKIGFWYQDLAPV